MTSSTFSLYTIPALWLADPRRCKCIAMQGSTLCCSHFSLHAACTVDASYPVISQQYWKNYSLACGAYCRARTAEAQTSLSDSSQRVRRRTHQLVRSAPRPADGLVCLSTGPIQIKRHTSAGSRLRLIELHTVKSASVSSKGSGLGIAPPHLSKLRSLCPIAKASPAGSARKKFG